MRSEDRLQDRKAGLLVAEQLRDQREIEPLARFDAAVEQARNQSTPQGAKIVAGLDCSRQSGKTNMLGIARPGNAGSM